MVELKDPSEFRRMEMVQRNAWGISEKESVIPSHNLIAAQHHGGLVLGAYQDGVMVGCLFGIAATSENNRVYHYSHITCVLKNHQGTGVGYLLKKRQRTLLLDRGVNLVKWTYDPLQLSNAYFNLRKLGAIVREYHRDLYGPMPDSLNRNMVSDRFEAEWWIDSARVKETLDGSRVHQNIADLKEEDAIVNRTAIIKSTVRRPVKLRLSLDQKYLLFEIPNSIGMVKEENLDIARSWTLHLRRGFETYFKKGYAVTDVLLEGKDRDTRAYYLLERGFHPETDPEVSRP